MKGIILAGGSGTRLFPATKVVVKQLLPVYDKPMVYYPLSVLMLANIREILIISTPENLPAFRGLLGDGAQLGLSLSYAVQDHPGGIAEAFLIGEDFIGDSSVCLILGDNLFYGEQLGDKLKEGSKLREGAHIFGYYVKNPSDFGVCEFSEDGRVISIEEKPSEPKSNFAVPGLYFYDNDVVKIAKSIRPSDRGELEITAVNNAYIQKGKMQVTLMGRGMAWFDCGTPGALLRASNFVEMIQERQGRYIACLHEIAWRSGFISDEDLLQSGTHLKNSEYGQYMLNLPEVIA